MSVERRGKKGVYYMYFMFQGQRIAKSTGKYDRNEALIEEAKERKRLMDELRLPEHQRIKPMRLSEAFERAYKERWSENKDGLKTFRRAMRITELIGNKVITEVTSDDVQELIDKLREEKAKDATVNRYLEPLKTMFNMALKKWGKVNKLPYIELKKVKEGRLRIISYEEEAELIRRFKLRGCPDMADLVPVLADTGARLSNILNLDLKDVNFKTDMINIWKNKADKPYSVPMTSRVRLLLLKKKAQGFQRPFAHIIARTFEKNWVAIKKEMGLEHDTQFVPHALRHTAASRLVENDVDLYQVKEWLGHAVISTTLKYAHLKPEKLLEAKNKLEKKKRSVG